MFEQIAVLQQAGSQAGGGTNVVGLAVTALVALVAGALGAYVNARMVGYATQHDFSQALLRLEENTRAVGEINATIARRSTLDSELREAVREFAVAAGGMIHGMCWLTWDCVEREKVNPALVSGYDKEAHTLLPAMVAQLAVIAMLNPDRSRQTHAVRG